MSSMMESKLTAEQHRLLRDVLIAQTEAHGLLEMPVVQDVLSRHGASTVLDIGCGEGSFLLRLARHMPSTRFSGIDHSVHAIDDASGAVRREGLSNVTLRTAFFDPSFDPTFYDGITTRYTLQHASQPQAFVDAAFARVTSGGTFIAMESFDACTGCHEPSAVWERFRSAIAIIHKRVGSNQNMGQSLGGLLKSAGFHDIRVFVLLCAPSTVGWERFRALIQGSARLANAFFSDVFDNELRSDIAQWLEDRARIERADPFLCSAVAHGTRR